MTGRARSLRSDLDVTQFLLLGKKIKGGSLREGAVDYRPLTGGWRIFLSLTGRAGKYCKYKQRREFLVRARRVNKGRSLRRGRVSRLRLVEGRRFFRKARKYDAKQY